MAQFKEEAFSEEQIKLLLDTWMEQVRDATIKADAAHSDAITLEEWVNAVAKLKSQCDFAREN